MINDIVGDNGSRFIIAAAAVALGLLCLVAVLWVMRNRPSSPFIRGGKNRQPRLAVLDAAAVDTRRRLVLVRRDDVEHLIMIGGPTDIVIESRIGGVPLPDLQPAATETVAATPRPVAERRPAPQPQEQRPQPAVRPVETPATPSGVSAMGNVLYGESFDAAPVTRAAQPANMRPRTEAVAARPTPPVERAVQPAPVQQRPQPAAPAPSVQHARTPEDILDAARNRVLATEQRPPQPAVLPIQTAEPQPVQDNKAAAADFERILDAEISGDLGRLGAGPDVRLDGETRGTAPAAGRQEPRFAAGQPRNEPTLEEEMNRMLGEMSADRKP